MRFRMIQVFASLAALILAATAGQARAQSFAVAIPAPATRLAAVGDTVYVEDFNGDGVVDARDAVWLLRHIAESPDDISCDYNRDGRVNVGDVLALIKNINVGRLTPLIPHAGKYPLMGRVVEGGAGVAWITISIRGESVDTSVQTSELGMYKLENLESGRYTLRPSRNNYRFVPDSLIVSVEGDTLFVPDIQATFSGYAVNGTVLLDTVGTVGLAEVSIRITGPGKDTTVTSDGLGKYRVVGLSAGDYVFRPQKEYYTFNPDSLIVTVRAGQSTVVPEFKAKFSNPSQITMRRIGGRVWCSSGGISNVRIIIKSAQNEYSTLSNQDGYYSVMVPEGRYSVIPVFSIGYAFNPIQYDATITGSDLLDLNFFMYGLESLP